MSTGAGASPNRSIAILWVPKNLNFPAKISGHLLIGHLPTGHLPASHLPIRHLRARHFLLATNSVCMVVPNKSRFFPLALHTPNWKLHTPFWQPWPCPLQPLTPGSRSELKWARSAQFQRVFRKTKSFLEIVNLDFMLKVVQLNIHEQGLGSGGSTPGCWAKFTTPIGTNLRPPSKNFGHFTTQ